MILTSAKFFTMFDQDIIAKSQLIQIQQALKLQELVKKYLNSPAIKEITDHVQEWGTYDSGQDDTLTKLQSLVEESEK